MRIKIVKALIKKEILDVLRDKKAVVMMIIVPLVLYPLIFFGTLAVMSAVQTSMRTNEYKVVIGTNGEEVTAEWVRNLQSAIDEHNAPSDGKDGKENTTTDYIEITSVGNDWDYDKAVSAIQREEIDAYIEHYTDSGDGRDVYEVVYISSVTNSSYAADILKAIFDKMNRAESERLIEDAGLSPKLILSPLVFKNKDIASKEQTTGNLLGMVLPMLLVISLLMGTMYPAIDATAGEKERGTLETLLTLPVTNREIIISKFFTIAMIGIASALLNLISMGLMGIYMVKLVGSLGGAKFNVSIGSFIPAIIITILAVLVFSLFISAVTMCITAFASSYKEANNYITPMTLVVMLTGYIAFIPNIELTRNMALVPVANICLLVKNILSFKYDMAIIALVLLSNVVYAGIAILFLGRIYDSEAILFDEGRSGIQLFEKRINMKKGGVPTTGDAWFILFVMLILTIYLGSIFQVKFGIGGVVMIQIMLLAIPMLFVVYTKRSIIKTYNINFTGIGSFVGGIMLMAGVIMLGIVLSGVAARLFPEEAESVGSSMNSLLTGYGLPVTLFIVAFLPAFCEEMMFRGFIFSAFKSRYKLKTAILLTSIAFGIYHMSIVRFFTTALLGAAIAVADHYAGSLLPGVIMHFMNNSLAVFQMFYPEQFSRIPIFSEQGIGIIGIGVLIFLGAFLAFTGTSIIVLTNKGKKNGHKEGQN